jgi:hypothetical protein
MQFHNRCIIFATRSCNVGRKSRTWLIIRTNETSIEIEFRSNLTTLFMPSIRFIRRSQISWSCNQTRFKMQLKHWTFLVYICYRFDLRKGTSLLISNKAIIEYIYDSYNKMLRTSRYIKTDSKTHLVFVTCYKA